MRVSGSRAAYGFAVVAFLALGQVGCSCCQPASTSSDPTQIVVRRLGRTDETPLTRGQFAALRGELPEFVYADFMSIVPEAHRVAVKEDLHRWLSIHTRRTAVPLGEYTVLINQWGHLPDSKETRVEYYLATRTHVVAWGVTRWQGLTPYPTQMPIGPKSSPGTQSRNS